MRTRKFDPKGDYPLALVKANLIRTPSGKSLQDITIESVVSGKIVAQDIRIRAETLEFQARIAGAHGRTQMAANFRRAAELTRLSDEEIFRVYDALRPRRSTKEELLAIARELEEKYQAKINADFIREATDIYEKRGLLKKA